MPSFDTAHVKNIVLLGHAGSGKTTLAECMLFEGGLIQKRGSVEERNTVGDFYELEKERGYVEAQQQVTTYLSNKVWIPLWDLLEERLASINPENSVVFLTRVAAMSPGIFHMSMLLDKMHGKTKVATILFYPGSIEGTTGLRFMDLKDRDALGNYRVKIYG